MEDIKMAIEMAKTTNGPSSELLTSSLADNSKLLYAGVNINCQKGDAPSDITDTC